VEAGAVGAAAVIPVGEAEFAGEAAAAEPPHGAGLLTTSANCFCEEPEWHPVSVQTTRSKPHKRLLNPKGPLIFSLVI
jgi:hypothetical protein